MVDKAGISVLRALVAIAVIASTMTACSNSQDQEPSATIQATIVDDAGMADEADGANWLAFGRTYSEQRFSPLTQVDTDTVRNLKVDWYLDLPDDRGLVSTPLVVDGILYFVGSMNRVRAVDATNGTLLWEYDPKVFENTTNDMRAGWEHNRGIGIWQDKVFVATWDGRLNALNRQTGEEVWSVRTTPEGSALYITGAPKVFKGKVLIGNGGTENGPTRGYVTAYGADSGEEAWRFYIVPGNPADGFENDAMRMAAETWTGEWWKFGGGGNAWHGFTYDAELDQLYIGTGNGSPWNRKIRSPGGGDNLFLSSIVALDPDTGEYLWHYQTTPGETWDFNSNMDIVLADLEIDGENVKAILHAPKNGFFYVIDRTDGRLLSAEKFAETTWATHVDVETGRPVEVAGARYEEGPAEISPTFFGAHSWHAMSYNPVTGLAYIPTINLTSTYTDQHIDVESWEPAAFRKMHSGVGTRNLTTVEGKAPGALQAFDPVTGEPAWEIPMPGLWNAGTLTTAGNLLFQGRATGEFVAYDAGSGDELWRFDAGLGISAPPITYAVDGRQYIAVLVGFGGAAAGIPTGVEVSHGWAYGAQMRRLMAFSLAGNADVPPQPPAGRPEPLAVPDFEVDEQLAQAGRAIYALCGYCHGGGAVSAGMAPDLRASPIMTSFEAVAEITRDGSRKDRGMPRYAWLQDEHILAIQHYIRDRANQALEQQ